MRKRLGSFLLVAVMAVAGDLTPSYLLVRGNPFEPVSVEPVSDAEQRLAPLRRRLAPLARVGYISSLRAWSSEEWARRYLEAQYSLAPIVVAPHADATIVLVDADDDNDAALEDLLRRAGLQRIESIGRGLALAQRAP
jgi:hypothetical protein